MYYILDLEIPELFEWGVAIPESYETEKLAKKDADKYLNRYAILKIEDTISQVILQDGTSVTIGKK